MDAYIAIEGVIGVGKTTLARYLEDELDATLVLERFDENPFLADFYEDRDAYAFQTQIFFLLSRYQQQQKMTHMPRPLVTDYLFDKDYIFAQLNLHGDELSTYEGVYQALAEKIPQPDLVIYLQASPETLLRRIALRDRPYERNMDPAYIENLCRAYNEFYSQYERVPLLTVAADDIDFVANASDRHQIMAHIQQVLEENGVTHHPTPPARRPSYDPARVPLTESSRRLPDFQRFHHHLDTEKGFNTDLLLNMVLLQEEVGELANAVKHHWRGLQRGVPDAAREALKSELADVLAYILKLANYTGVELEAAYLAKMADNRRRTWDSPEGNEA